MKKVLVALAGAVALLAVALPVHADGNGATTYTQTMKDQVTAFPVSGCGPAGMITQTSNSVFHFTINAAGDVWGTSTTEGSFTLAPFDPSLPVYSGHIAIWFGFSFNNQNQVTHSTFNAVAHAPDGSTIDMHEDFHLSVSAGGVVLSFDNASC